jgi:dTDP-glucose 4,6-dehydratase
MDDIFSGKKILVTGATGLIGGGVAQALLKQGCQIRAMVRNSERAAPLAHQGFEVVLGDMADSPALERAVAGCQVVLHFASALGDEFASPAYIHKVIVDGTLKLAEVALTVGVERFVHTSTSWVYGYKAGPGATEQSPYTFSHDPYIDSKIEAEQGLLQMYRAQGLPLVIVQPSIVYGPGDRHWTVKPLRFSALLRLG